MSKRKAASSASGGKADEEVTEIEGVRVTSPGKLLWPDLGLTKRDLAEYWIAVAPRALPGLARRPLSLVRFPQGVTGASFYQKHDGSLPKVVPRIDTSSALSDVPWAAPIPMSKPYVYVDGVPALMGLVQMSCIELHPWSSTVDDLAHADQLVMDLDPDDGLPWTSTVAAARDVRGRLQELGLEPFLRTTGGKGLHLVAPIVRGRGWDEVKAFTKALTDELAARSPERYTAKITKKSRVGKIYIDFLRNQWDATAIGSWSPRGRAGAPVATPLAWEELSDGLDPKGFTLRTVRARLAAPDPWASFEAARRPITDEAWNALRAEVPTGRPRRRRSREE